MYPPSFTEQLRNLRASGLYVEGLRDLALSLGTRAASASGVDRQCFSIVTLAITRIANILESEAPLAVEDGISGAQRLLPMLELAVEELSLEAAGEVAWLALSWSQASGR